MKSFISKKIKNTINTIKSIRHNKIKLISNNKTKPCIKNKIYCIHDPKKNQHIHKIGRTHQRCVDERIEQISKKYRYTKAKYVFDIAFAVKNDKIAETLLHEMLKLHKFKWKRKGIQTKEHFNISVSELTRIVNLKKKELGVICMINSNAVCTCYDCLG